jgi:hypothetical protein
MRGYALSLKKKPGTKIRLRTMDRTYLVCFKKDGSISISGGKAIDEFRAEANRMQKEYRERNPESCRTYMREYMRKWYAQQKNDQQAWIDRSDEERSRCSEERKLQNFMSLKVSTDQTYLKKRERQRKRYYVKKYGEKIGKDLHKLGMKIIEAKEARDFESYMNARNDMKTFKSKNKI